MWSLNIATLTKNERWRRKRAVKRYAAQARNRLTAAESALSMELKRLDERWWTQKPILCDGYIADFYHPKARLIVEADGGYHLSEEQQALDALRDSQCRAHHYKVIRYSNEAIMANPAKVAARIQRIAKVLMCAKV